MQLQVLSLSWASVSVVESDLLTARLACAATFSLSFLHLGYISGIAARSTYLLDVTVYWCSFFFVLNTAAFGFVARQLLLSQFTLSMISSGKVCVSRVYLFTFIMFLGLLLS